MKINRENAEGKWELPPALKATPERLEAWAAEQRKLAQRANSPFANLSPSEHARARASRHVEELTTALKFVEKKLGKVFTSGGAESFEELQAAQQGIWRQLAEAHATTGRFDLAAHYEYDRGEKARYLRYWRAVWRDDEHFCTCPPTLAGLPQFFAVADVWSVKHNREVILVRCGACKCLNVTTRREVLAPILEQRAHRRAAVATGARTRAEEARMLRGRGTKELLLK
jgi:hypothetical protein